MTARLNQQRSFRPALAWGILASVVLAIALPAFWLERYRGGGGAENLEALSRFHFQVDVNQASLAELQALPGIGPNLAGRIVEHRRRNGAFVQLEDLRQVQGMGAVLYQQILPYLRLESPAPSQMD